VTRKEAERNLLMRENDVAVFLIRESETCPGKGIIYQRIIIILYKMYISLRLKGMTWCNG